MPIYSLNRNDMYRKGTFFVPERELARTEETHRLISALQLPTYEQRVARITELFAGFDPDADMLMGDSSYIHVPTVTVDNLPAVAVANRLSQFITSLNTLTSNDAPTSAQYLDSIVSILSKYRVFHVWSRDLFDNLRSRLVSGNNSMSGSSGQCTYDRVNISNLLKAILDVSNQGMRDYPPKRKMLRNHKLQAEAWSAEIVLCMNNHFAHGQIPMCSKMALELADLSSSCVERYTTLRGCVPYRAEFRGVPVLSGTDSVASAFRKYNQRILSAVCTIDSIRPTAGGPGFTMPDGFVVNVENAYRILAKCIRRRNTLVEEGNSMAFMDGHFWKCESTDMPLIEGSGNKKHLEFVRMVDACAKLIASYPPSSTGDGEFILPELTGHIDASGNKKLYAHIKTCAACGFRGSDKSSLTNGMKYRAPYSHATESVINSPYLKDKHICSDCAAQSLVLAIDTCEYIYRTEGSVIEVAGFRGLERIVNRSHRVTKAFAASMTKHTAACKCCGSNSYNIEKIKADADAPKLFVRLCEGISGDSPTGMMMASSAARAPESGLLYRINVQASVWDNEAERRVCGRCANIQQLYLDKTTGKYYSNIDNSPCAPEYGYKVPDPSGKWLDRVIGIEFETGPGSATVQKKDIFLNGKCSDGIHVWHIHSDGSLMGGACEITTPPIGGLAIPMGVDAMFDLAKAHGFMIENRQAGMHVHVDITDMFSVLIPIKRLHDTGKLANAGYLYKRFAQLIGNFGDAVSMISRQFVSAFRRQNQYCSGGFGVRSWGCGSGDPIAQYQSTVGSGRQAMCLHMHNGYANRTKVTYTFENRIWPSSNSKEYTLARAELTQRAVDMFCKLAIPFLKQEEGAEERIAQFVKLLVDIAPYSDGGERIPLNQLVRIPDITSDILGLSPDCRETLKKLHKRFFWISYHAHEQGLSPDCESIRALRNEALKSSGGSRSFVTVACSEEMAGILIQKGFGDPTTSKNLQVLREPSCMVVMDTVISSSAYNPLATDASDLVSAINTTVNH